MARPGFQKCQHTGCRKKAVQGGFCAEHVKHYQQPGEPLDGNGDVQFYEHRGAHRTNNPEAGLAEYDREPRGPRKRYNYDPFLQPQLVWAEKPGLKARWDEVWEPEQMSFEVDTVSLHVHERVSPKAIIRGLRRPIAKQPSLFEPFDLSFAQLVDFYRHEVDWSNRLILGDSALVMNSLLERESLSGQVQMIYMDPPYGIKYSSNWQARIDRREVKDTDDDLSREPEQIKAYRDTWELDVHSYLNYLRDRLLLCRDLLAESGSIFVQINDERLHHVKELMDEVFLAPNFLGVISYVTTSGFPSLTLSRAGDYLLWYARDRQVVKYNQLYSPKEAGLASAEEYKWLMMPDGSTRALTRDEHGGRAPMPEGARQWRYGPLTSSGQSGDGPNPFGFQGRTFAPGQNNHWKVQDAGLDRLAAAGLMLARRNSLAYYMFADNYPVVPINNLWSDTKWGFDAADKTYAVQTNSKVVERCILMATDPGDLVLDPTCGSGTTAFCAEKWGRRWITCDTSRVSLFLARQRLMTAAYGYYELADPAQGPRGDFMYKAVPHITLESIAYNEEIDEIAAEYQPRLDQLRARVNKLAKKKMAEWELPRPEDAVTEGWPAEARAALEEYWAAWIEKKRKVDDSIQRRAPQENLIDQPRIVKGKVRVSGPFTVEAIPVPTVADPEGVEITEPEGLEAFLTAPAGDEEDDEGGGVDGPQATQELAAGDWVDKLVGLLAKTGVVFPGGRKVQLEGLRRADGQYIHAEGSLGQNGEAKRVALSFGPPYGPVTQRQVEEALHEAKWEYDMVIFAGFAFDTEVGAFLDKNPHPKIEVHRAHIAPDVLTGDLLKTTRTSQLFTVYGEPEIALSEDGGQWRVELTGVDLYDPLTGETTHEKGDRVAAWFLDTDYDGHSFHVCQAFFPYEAATSRDPWDKLERALKGKIDEEIMEAFRGTVSLPFEAGSAGRVAVKVIDLRGNEVVKVLKLEQQAAQ